MLAFCLKTKILEKINHIQNMLFTIVNILQEYIKQGPLTILIMKEDQGVLKTIIIYLCVNEINK